jgi:hypothetical protein
MGGSSARNSRGKRVEQTIKTLNILEQRGLLGRYAIGGAMAAMFYTEPLLTFDLDVFVTLPEGQGGLLTLTPLYEALKAEGHQAENECIAIHGVPVQFLPAYNSLLEEALAEALETTYETTPTRVLRPEHLIAICLQTGRAKDQQRVRLLAEQAVVDPDRLARILARHHLEEKWGQWKP